METFPGGVLSSDASIGVTRIITNDAEIVSIDLKTGMVRWRQTSTGIPVAATDNLLVVLETTPAVSLTILDLASGKQHFNFQNTNLPAWVADIVTQPEFMIFTAAQKGDALIVNWTVDSKYVGGAAPTKALEKEERRTGGVRIDLGSGNSESIQADEPAELSDPETSTLEPYHPLIGEVSRKRVGDRQYVLRTEPNQSGRESIKLDALDGKGETTLWETTLGEIEQTNKPGPLRK